jgi:hypothetical protein
MTAPENIQRVEDTAPLSKYNLDPHAAIVGHRDYNVTQCPGDVFYARLPELRDRVAAVLFG